MRQLRNSKNSFSVKKKRFVLTEYRNVETSCDKSCIEILFSSFSEIKLITLTNNRSEFIRNW